LLVVLKRISFIFNLTSDYKLLLMKQTMALLKNDRQIKPLLQLATS